MHLGAQDSSAPYPSPAFCNHAILVRTLSLGLERENRTTLSCPACVGRGSGCQKTLGWRLREKGLPGCTVNPGRLSWLLPLPQQPSQGGLTFS